jgi:hypothetical protein
VNRKYIMLVLERLYAKEQSKAKAKIALSGTQN